MKKLTATIAAIIFALTIAGPAFASSAYGREGGSPPLDTGGLKVCPAWTFLVPPWHC